MNHNPDEYYNRSEVSNSDLTTLQNLLHPKLQFGDKEKAFKFGTLLDAIITETERVNFYTLQVDDVQYSEDDFELAREMQKSLRMEARTDMFLAMVLKEAETQAVSVHKKQQFMYGDFGFTLDTRCKWDWFFRNYHFGGDLKSTFASTQKQFEEALEFFSWIRSRAWYMDVEGTNRDFIYAISKKNCKVFKKFFERDDKYYQKGKEEYSELAFNWWCLNGS